jgi:hypothetical protein
MVTRQDGFLGIRVSGIDDISSRKVRTITILAILGRVHILVFRVLGFRILVFLADLDGKGTRPIGRHPIVTEYLRRPVGFIQAKFGSPFYDWSPRYHIHRQWQRVAGQR